MFDLGAFGGLDPIKKPPAGVGGAVVGPGGSSIAYLDLLVLVGLGFRR